MKTKVIYKITNLINGKIYIGQSNQPEVRWSKHKSSALNAPTQTIHSAMKKYGIDNFIFEVICSILPIIDELEYCKIADEYEEYFIQEYQSHISLGKGYNVTNGGSTSPKTEKWRQKQKEKHAANRKARFTPEIVNQIIQFYTKDELNLVEIAEKIGLGCDRNMVSFILKENNIPIVKHKSRSNLLRSKTNKGRMPTNLEQLIWISKNNNPVKGKELSKEHKDKLSESHKGLHNSPDTQFHKGHVPWNKYQ